MSEYAMDILGVSPSNSDRDSMVGVMLQQQQRQKETAAVLNNNNNSPSPQFSTGISPVFSGLIDGSGDMLRQVSMTGTSPESMNGASIVSGSAAPPPQKAGAPSRGRKKFSYQQVERLMHVLHHVTDTPSYDLREELSRELSMTNREVQVWFQNRRAKVARLKADKAKKEMMAKQNLIYAANAVLNPHHQQQQYQQQQQQQQQRVNVQRPLIPNVPLMPTAAMFQPFYAPQFMSLNGSTSPQQQQQLQQQQIDFGNLMMVSPTTAAAPSMGLMLSSPPGTSAFGNNAFGGAAGGLFSFPMAMMPVLSQSPSPSPTRQSQNNPNNPVGFQTTYNRSEQPFYSNESENNEEAKTARSQKHRREESNSDQMDAAMMLASAPGIQSTQRKTRRG